MSFSVELSVLYVLIRYNISYQDILLGKSNSVGIATKDN